MLRDPRSGFIAYAPVGSIKKGEALVRTGGNGDGGVRLVSWRRSNGHGAGARHRRTFAELSRASDVRHAGRVRDTANGPS